MEPKTGVSLPCGGGFKLEHDGEEGCLCKHRFLGSALRVSDSIDPGWDLRRYISSKFPDDANATVQGPHLEKHCHPEVVPV